ncbi:MAG: hypothetical protein ACXWX9_06750 [Actinomycetota bacterium]
MIADRPRRAFVLGASIASFVLLATVAATPGSPFTPVLPAGARSSGPFRWLAELAGLDGVHGNALVAIGVVTVAVAAAAFLLVLRECWRGRIAPRTVLWLAIGYHVALLFVPLVFSRDVYSYAYYGRIAATYSANPYVVTPADFPHDELARFVGPRWFDTPAVYGPLWTQASALVMRLVDSVSASIVAFRLIAIVASLATLGVLAGLVRRVRPEREAFALAVLGLNPVVLFQSVASGHNDLLVALAVAGALALGTLVKATAAVPLLLFVLAQVAARPAGERARTLASHAGVAVGLGLVAAIPFLNTRDPSLGMFELASHEGWLAPSRLFRRLLSAVSGGTLGVVPRVVFPVLLFGALFLLGRELVRRAPATPWLDGAAWGWGLAGVMLLGPVLLPWYVTWALPLAWLLPRTPRAVLIATGTALTVSQWTSEPTVFASAYDANVLFGHYVVTPLVVGLLVWLLLDLWRRTRRGAPLEDAPRDVPAPAGER